MNSNAAVKAISYSLNGNQYKDEVSQMDIEHAQRNGVVIVFGASDDLMEFRGAINGEVYCYDGGKAYITDTGELLNNTCVDDCPHYELAKKAATEIKAIWGEGEYSWTYETELKHETFEIVEDGEPYCRGIVFSLHE